MPEGAAPFDWCKEGMFILNRKRPFGKDFQLLGVTFDCKLIMQDTVHELARDCGWKLKAILRTRDFNTGAALINLYKAQILSVLEYRTAAIYHACSSALEELQHVQDRLLEAAGVDRREALNSFHLAPLAARRDMAMLGLIHRTVLGLGPACFSKVFHADVHARNESRSRHRLQLKPLECHPSDFALPGSRPADYIERSLFGLIHIYNMLPASIVESSSSVAAFQKNLQNLLLHRAMTGCHGWESTFCPRVPSWRHPLKDLPS